MVTSNGSSARAEVGRLFLSIVLRWAFWAPVIFVDDPLVSQNCEDSHSQDDQKEGQHLNTSPAYS
jgi:hypothetical protein